MNAPLIALHLEPRRRRPDSSSLFLIRHQPDQTLNSTAMSPVTNSMLNARREKDCTDITTERKYFHIDGSFVKRSLRPHEWQHSPFRGSLCIPRLGSERLLNEAAALRFITKNTNIPVPKLHACFEDDGAVYLITEYIDGVPMADLEPEKRKTVETELEVYIATLRSLQSNVWGGPSGLVSLFLCATCPLPIKLTYIGYSTTSTT